MQQTTLPGTGLTLSRLGFGTASLLTAGCAGAREGVLRAAFDSGFTHYDTAPLYGFGNAERDLGRAFGNRPDVTIATKVGLRSPGGDDQRDWLAVGRKAAGRVVPALSAAQADFALGWAQQSLEGSLRRLQRECIDLLLLHEPEYAWLDQDGWRRWLEDTVREGKVRYFGLAAHAQRIAPFLAAGSPLCPVVQIADSLDRCEADLLASHGRAMQITYGYVSASPAAPVSETIRAALARNANGCVLYSTRKADRARSMARAVL